MVLLCEYRPGDLFGALGELDPAPEEAEIVAVEAARSFILKSRELVAAGRELWLHRPRSVAAAAAPAAGGRRRGCTSGRRSRRSAGSMPSCCGWRGLRPDLAIRPAPVLAELAVRVSTTRETASRAVNALERRGIIRRDADALVVVAPQRLEELII